MRLLSATKWSLAMVHVAVSGASVAGWESQCHSGKCEEAKGSQLLHRGITKRKHLEQHGQQESQHAPKQKDHANASRISKKVYVPSSWEVDWMRSVGGLMDDDPQWAKGCNKMKSQQKNVDLWMDLWQERETWTPGKLSAATWSPEVFSYHKIIDSQGKEVARIPLEPLVGFLRHPRHICFVADNSLNVNKDYMFPSWHFEVFPTKPARAWLFDVGASTYKQGARGASQEWFLQTYKSRGIDFDRVLAWEAQSHTQHEIYDDMPSNVVDRVSYYNLPASANLTDKFSPLRALKELVHPDDFVVLKIDIDAPKVETDMVATILKEPSLCAKIDDLFWEHHTSKNPMVFHGWGPTKGLSDMNMQDSYRIFSQLRECGIRAHSWV